MNIRLPGIIRSTAFVAPAHFRTRLSAITPPPGATVKTVAPGVRGRRFHPDYVRAGNFF
ncbi:hypothetical protein [Chryseobacterium sp. MFBS3-17]|uniref:hypothetical protein n=1 Tax=Chryseobacterium sp. MFBS3-17 TaxID=2886689 RepID=UPI001D0E94A3|nr:hypothetical protein [Chryseobacterium sp. MFBS3-17]MCC2590458.1 hypothetical protein [Chryseobacterium sp. MFBS3-17]